MSLAAKTVPRFLCLFLARHRACHIQNLTSPALASPSPPRYENAWTYSGYCTWSGLGRRAYSSVGSPAPGCVEDVTVACGSNGTITLNIFHPVAKEDPTSPVILYLPTALPADPGYDASDEKIIGALSAASNGTIVRLNYRLGDGFQYPTPVHDVLSGYDYVKQRFAFETGTTRTGRPKKTTHLRMGVCGQLVGGSLAAMLGLTESRLGEDRIAAIAINCPIVNWIFPERVPSEGQITAVEHSRSDGVLEKAVRRRRRKAVHLSSWEAFSDAEGLATTQLEAARSTFFKKPANYFDPFATPVHFLRSAGVEVLSEGTADLDDISMLSTAPKPRKSPRSFPPSNSSLILPHVRLSVGDANPLLDQDEEFVKLLRRSVVRNVENRASTQALLDRFDEAPATDLERLAMAVAAAEEKIEYHLHPGTGLWGTAERDKWLGEVWNVGRWFRKILG